MMLGWRTFFKILISLVILSTSFLSLILSFSRILTATYSIKEVLNLSSIVNQTSLTFSPVKVWVASFTFPKVPFPKDFPKVNKYEDYFQ